MTKRRRRFTPRERMLAVELAERLGPAEAARHLGVNVSTITSWQAKAKADPALFDPPKRERHAPDVVAEALRIAEERGDAAAEAETGVKQGTIRSWRVRARPDDYATVIEGQGYSLEQLCSLQSRLGNEIHRAADEGSSMDAQRLAVAFGILTDKIRLERKERSMTMPEHDDEVPTRTGAYSRDELGELQRHTGQLLRRAIDAGRSVDAQRLGVIFRDLTETLGLPEQEPPRLEAVSDA